MELTCIVCPRGCTINYDLVDGQAVNITGNTCIRGKKYCETEVVSPTRMITSTVKVENGLYNQLPVITSAPVPKAMIFDVVQQIKKVTVKAPVNVNDVIIENVCGTGVNILASRSL